MKPMSADVATSRKQYPSLKAWRTAKRLKQTEAAAILGIDNTQYCKWEAGQISPHRTRLDRVSKITGVPLLTLLRVA